MEISKPYRDNGTLWVKFGAGMIHSAQSCTVRIRNKDSTAASEYIIKSKDGLSYIKQWASTNVLPIINTRPVDDPARALNAEFSLNFYSNPTPSSESFLLGLPLEHVYKSFSETDALQLVKMSGAAIQKKK